jgi:nickel-dependent lactate racemase
MPETMGGQIVSPAKRMGGMNKLSDFGRSQDAATFEKSTPIKTAKKSSIKAVKTEPEKLASVNIKVPISQQKWLADTAQQVRNNNDMAVVAADRVFPQHLIQVAIDLLKAQGIDWAEVKNIAELRDSLNI